MARSVKSLRCTIPAAAPQQPDAAPILFEMKVRWRPTPAEADCRFAAITRRAPLEGACVGVGSARSCSGTAAASHPDRRAVLSQIVAPYVPASLAGSS